jgi:hypothetical protein
MATADYYDVVITNMEGAVYCGETNVFYPLDKYLDEESYNKVKDKIVILNNMDGQPGQYAIDVSDNEFMKSLNVGYDDIYIGFAGDQILMYLLELEQPQRHVDTGQREQFHQRGQEKLSLLFGSHQA